MSRRDFAGTLEVKSTGLYPRVRVDAAGSGVVSQAGGLLLTGAVRVSGLDLELSRALAPWCKPLARHDPAKIVTDLAVALGLGGDCLADIAVLRGEPDLFGPVASDPTVSRVVDALAGDVEAVLKAINVARAAARARVWALAGEHAPDTDSSPDDPLIIDTDATLVTSHSDKQGAAPTFKRGYGFHPLCAFVDHGPDGSGEPLAVMLRPGNAGSNTAAAAPRGAASYPQHSWDELEGRFVGLMAYLNPKGEGDESMPGKQCSCSDV
jgi:hypothetical protein